MALTRPDKVSGIASFSGRILETTKSNISKNSKLKNLKVYLSHSINNNVLQYTYAEASKNLLDSLNIETLFKTDNFGHTLP